MSKTGKLSGAEDHGQSSAQRKWTRNLKSSNENVENKQDPFTSMVKVRMCNEEVIAFLDTGSGGNNCGLSLVSEAFRNMWKKPFGKNLRPVYQSATTVGGEKLDILGAVMVDLEIIGRPLQQDVLVVRNMQQPVILG